MIHPQRLADFDKHRRIIGQFIDEIMNLLLKRHVASLARPHISSQPRCAGAKGNAFNQWGFEFPEGAHLLNLAGLYLQARGRYTDAKSLYERALAIREKTLDPQHPDVAQTLHNLASLYRVQGQYDTAEPLF